MSKLDARRRFGARIVRDVQAELEERGYTVKRMPHNWPHDLEATRDQHCYAIEVKASHYGRKWQANLRDNSADYLVWACVDPKTGHLIGMFVIPWQQVAGRKVLTIARRDVTQYRGVWAPYWEKWP